jgi:polyphosphate kinase
MNALDDPGMIRSCTAPRAGVKVDLIVRGHSPAAAAAAGVQREHPGGEHRGALPGARPRLLLRTTAATPEIFIGSADWRERNLNERVETLVPVLDPALRERLERSCSRRAQRQPPRLGAAGRRPLDVQRTPAPGEPDVELPRPADARRPGAQPQQARPWEVML